MNLEDLGWADSHASAWMQLQDSTLVPARVCSNQREHYRLWTAGDDAELDGQLSGGFRHRAQLQDMPVVGDFVAARVHDDGSRATIVECLPRRSALMRKRVERSCQPQLLAANLDSVLLVSSLNRDFNPRRIERALALIWDGGAQPVLVLSKLDLCADVELYRAQAAAVAPGVPIVALSTHRGQGLELLVPYLQPARTLALIGSSGVGKSSLVNALLGEARMATAAVRVADDRGRHTTTSRELFLLPGGALLIDTPGMRELGLWEAQAGLRSAFEEIEALSGGCRFVDCQHRSEPGCAVRHALEDHSLEAQRYQAYLKLQRELAHEARRTDPRARVEHRAQLRRVFRERKRALGQLPKK